MPAPPLPNPETPQGKEQLRFSMFTCSQQIDSKIFAYMKHIRSWRRTPGPRATCARRRERRYPGRALVWSVAEKLHG